MGVEVHDDNISEGFRDLLGNRKRQQTLIIEVVCCWFRTTGTMEMCYSVVEEEQPYHGIDVCLYGIIVSVPTPLLGPIIHPLIFYLFN